MRKMTGVADDWSGGRLECWVTGVVVVLALMLELGVGSSVLVVESSSGRWLWLCWQTVRG